MQKYKSKARKEVAGSGLGGEELTEYKQLLEDLIEKYEESKRRTEESSSDKKVQGQEDKKKAMDMQKRPWKCMVKLESVKILKEKMTAPITGWNYGRSSVMTDQISNLTEQSFPEICRNDQSLNETIWTPKCDKLHVFDMMEEMKRKSLLTEYYLCMQQNFMTQKLIHFAYENY